EEYASAIERVSSEVARDEPADPLDAYELDESVLGVLTEYEEHRLRTNVLEGLHLYFLHVRFSLTSIDSSLEELKARTKGNAEIVTYLPSMDGGEGDFIDLDVLMASP